MKKLLLATILGMLILAGTHLMLTASARTAIAAPNATTRYVAAVSGTDTGDCTSNTAPCRTLQYAVDQAQEGDDVWIAALDGTERAVYTVSTGPILSLDKTLTLRGGYSYARALGLWSRLIPALSTLDGQSEHQGIHITGNITATLERLSLNNGNAPQGGNLYAEDATVRFSAVLVISGTATHGGGIYLKNCHTEFEVTNFDLADLIELSGALVVQNNTAEYGGGIYAEGGNPALSAFAVFSNTASVYGGGVYLKEGKPIVAGGLVLDNQAGQQGGGFYLEQSLARIAGTMIYSNTAAQGAGLYLNGPLVTWPIDVPIIANNYIRYNQGGGLYFHQAIAGLANNIIADNVAEDGAAAYLWASSPQFYHNTLANNQGTSAVYITHKPGQIFPPLPPVPSLPRLVNTIIASHTLGIYVESTGLVYPLENRATLEGTLWWANASQGGGSGDIDSTHAVEDAPHFICTGEAPMCPTPYHIETTSAAVDAGVELTMDLPDDDAFFVDIDGQLRPSGAGYDIGADEVVTLSFNAWLIPTFSSITATPGEHVTHTHRLLNTGTQTDTYDLTLDSSTGWAELLTPRLITLGTQMSATVHVRVTVPPEATDGLSDSTRISATSHANPDQTAPALDTTFVVSESLALFDLTIDKETDVDRIDPGTAIPYTLTVTKPEALTETVTVTLTDSAVPTEAIGAWLLPPGCSGVLANGNFTCTWEMAPDTSSATLAMVITSAEAYSGTLINMATVNGSRPDINLVNNFAQATVNVGAPAAGVLLFPQLSPRIARPGERVTHTHTLRNTGDLSDIYDLTLNSSSEWAKLGTDSPITLNSQSTATVQVYVDVPSHATAGMTDTTILSATSRADPAQSAQALDTTLVISEGTETGDIAVSKWANPSTVNPGESIHYTILVTKSDTITKGVNITLTDTLVPTRAVAGWMLPTPCKGTLGQGRITCVWTLPPSTLLLTRTLPIYITTSKSFSGSLLNVASVSASVPEINLGNNGDQVTVTVGQPSTALYLPLILRTAP